MQIPSEINSNVMYEHVKGKIAGILECQSVLKEETIVN